MLEAIGAVTGQYHDRPGFVQRSRTIKPNIPSGYSFG